MPIAEKILEAQQRSSWIRKMFEQGARLKEARGPENVFDFSLGNPTLDPPPAYLDALRQELSQPPKGKYAYMPNTGYPDTRVIQGDDTTGLPISGSFSDSDGDTVYYTVTGLPTGTGLSIDSLTGDISGTPTLADVTASPVTVTVAATDGAIVATDDFTLTALNVYFTSTPVTTATEDAAYT